MKKKLEELEKRNNLLEKSLADYKDDEKTKWSEFKIEFNNDLRIRQSFSKSN